MSRRYGTSRRPLIKQGAILDSLRQQIISGELKPGDRMLTRDELAKHFDVSRMTLQRALDQLAEDGFIIARGNLGTFVAENPPHLSSYALVFYCTPDEPSWSRFWTALANEAVTLERTRRLKVATYYGVNGSTDSEDYQRLLHDVRARRLAGVIYAVMPDVLARTPLVEDATTPRVALMLPMAGCSVAAVYPDLNSFVDRALDALVARGRKRVAVVSNSHWWEPMGDRFVEAVQRRGLEFRPYWAQMVEASNVLRTVQLLMHNEQKTRPDGLIIADDNLVEHATAGLLAAGARVPEDVDVVAHCNFPWPVPSVVPVQRLGFDARQVMAVCLQIIDSLRRGQTVPAFQTVAARFEQEIGSAGSADAFPESGVVVPK